MLTLKYFNGDIKCSSNRKKPINPFVSTWTEKLTISNFYSIFLFFSMGFRKNSMLGKKRLKTFHGVGNLHGTNMK